jgi:hypothetical protein
MSARYTDKECNSRSIRENVFLIGETMNTFIPAFCSFRISKAPPIRSNDGNLKKHMWCLLQTANTWFLSTITLA